MQTMFIKRCSSKTRFRTLIDRILQMRLVYAKKSLNRQVSFEFLNRQLVWHAFTVSLVIMCELILFTSTNSTFIVLGIPAFPHALDQLGKAEVAGFSHVTS